MHFFVNKKLTNSAILIRYKLYITNNEYIKLLY